MAPAPLRCVSLSCTGALLLLWRLFFWHRWEKQFIFVGSRKSNFYVQCPVTAAVIKTLCCEELDVQVAQNGSCRKGAFARLMVSNRSPSAPIRFFFSVAKCQKQIVSVSSQWYFWDQQASLSVIMAKLTLSDAFSTPGSTRVSRTARVTRGPGSCRRGQSGTTGTSISCSCSYVVFLWWFYLNLHCLLFTGAPRK